MNHVPHPNRLRLVFNADDFGLSESVNRSILQGMTGEILRSASLMVTMPAAEDAVRSLAQSVEKGKIPSVGLGLHFSLTSGRALSDPKTIPLLATTDGRLKTGFAGLARLLTSRRKEEALRQIYEELDAQLAAMDRLMTLAPTIPIDHLDAHQHIQSLPGLLPRFTEIARERGWFLRLPTEPFGSLDRLLTIPFRNPSGVAKKGILDYFLRHADRKGLPDVTYFGILQSGQMTESAILSVLKTIPLLARRSGRSLFEINLHPWRLTGEKEVLPEIASDADHAFGLSPNREREFKALFSEKIRQKLKSLSIDVTSFHEMIDGERVFH